MCTSTFAGEIFRGKILRSHPIRGSVENISGRGNYIVEKRTSCEHAKSPRFPRVFDLCETRVEKQCTLITIPRAGRCDIAE